MERTVFCNLRRLALAALLIAGFASPAAAARAYHDITCETTATTGTGTISLGGASGQYLPFSTQFSSGDTVSYGITSGDGKYETGIGVYTSGTPGTMTRASSIISTDGVGTKLTLSGTSTVCVEFNSVWFQPNLGTGDSPTFAGATFSSTIQPSANDGAALGLSGTAWSDLFLASGGVINWNAGDVTLTHSSNNLTVAGGQFTSDAGGTHTFPDGWATNVEILDTQYPAFWLHGSTDNRGVVYAMDATTNKFWLEPESGGTASGTHQLYWDLTALAFEPGHNDDWSLGSATLSWSDLYLATGGVINWGNGNVTLTHSAGALTVAGATTVSFGTSAALTTGTIELGAASDTTLARTAAGRATVEGAPIGLYTFASSAPASPQVGDVWVDSTTSIAYRYVNDGDSSQWVQQPGNSVNTSTVKVQTFTASGTYTPTAGMKTAIIECVGSGAGGGGVALSSTAGAGGGGGGGSYSRAYVTAAQVGASQTVTVGAAGGGGAAGANNGTDGADVSVGTLCVGKGGTHGQGAAANTGGAGGAGGVAGTGDVTLPGQEGGPGITSTSGTGSCGGDAGAGFGAGAQCKIPFGAGANGSNYGAGGSGGGSNSSSAAAAGGNGAKGIVVITEYLTGP